MAVKKPITKIVMKNVTQNVIKVIDVQVPTLRQYSELFTKYPVTLKCPCSRASISYGKFLNIQYTFHKVCSSIFVTPDWISHLTMGTGDGLFLNDFRITGPYSFQALNTFCELARNTIDYNLNQFISNQFVSISVAHEMMFQLEILSRISQFQSSIRASFLLSRSMIQSTIQNNALVSGLQTNYRQSVQNDSVLSSPMIYNGCNCAYSSACTHQSAIYKYPEGTNLFNIPGFYTGCYVTESLLQSNLECFYDQRCINEIQTYLPSSMNVTALKPSLQSRYSINSTVRVLLDELMIEEYSTSIMYELYYAECQPVQCTYSVETVETVEAITMVETKNDVTYIVGMLIGIIGGLIAILNLIVPRLVKFIVYGIRKREIGVVSQTPIVPT